MKRIAILIVTVFYINAVLGQNNEATKDSFYLLTPIEVKAIRAGDLMPISKTNLSKKEISKNNLGQDLPFVLNQTVGVVANSDAGNGIGYTNLRIRGTDATRINVTLNGIPFNDAESQGTFFVDMPDISSSAGSIQIQRGVGSSSNGAGAFGASINISTNEFNKNAYTELNNSIGSFNSHKHTLKASTGLFGDHFVTDLRLSSINSDGYIDRAFSKLKSLYYSTAYINAKTSLRFNIISGTEKTYQAWNGISEDDIKAGRRTINYSGMEKPGTPYSNEIDKYQQNHFQLFFNQKLGNKFLFNTALFKTDGWGYYEQYKANQSYSKYGLANMNTANGLATKSDMIRRLGLKNALYGSIFSLLYKNKNAESIAGGGITRYNGNHQGKIIWAEKGITGTNKWYDLDASKTDFNFYLKNQTNIITHWYAYTDIQYCFVKYDIDGFRYNPKMRITNNYNFFNPKAGVTYLNKSWSMYFSFSTAHKEPNRDDYETGTNEQPRPEKLYDWELGIKKDAKNYHWSATLYYMKYKDQLVLTGKINDVGAYTRTNIPNSYRAGIELEGNYQFNTKLNVTGNLALSRNKIKNFTEYIDNYDTGGQIVKQYSLPNISFSPCIVSNAAINFSPINNFNASLIHKYVSKQYLDNTQDEKQVLHAYTTQDLLLTYTLKYKTPKELVFNLRLNNILNTKYESNGYTSSYFYNNKISVDNYYFPMAGFNFMFGVNVAF
ncbi:MAG: TonB-dependent receptor [Bacteroidetes bacterium]|nr:TonB-dependent receptor [Bacteroidota bacterium]